MHQLLLKLVVPEKKNNIYQFHFNPCATELFISAFIHFKLELLILSLASNDITMCKHLPN